MLIYLLFVQLLLHLLERGKHRGDNVVYVCIPPDLGLFRFPLRLIVVMFLHT